MKSKKYHLNKSKDCPAFDEYYTNEYEVNFIFNKIIDISYLKDKIIYLPADGEESEFVKYLKNHHDEILYKEMIYTWDDFRSHEDLFKKADIVITNPPFSLILSDLLPLLKKYECDFFIIGSLGMIYRYIDLFNNKECCYMRRRLPVEYDYFISNRKMEQNGSERVFVNYTLYASTIPFVDSDIIKKEMFDNRFMKKSIKDIECVWYDDGDERGKMLVIDWMKDVPYDYDGYMLLPISAYLSKYKDYLEYYENRNHNDPEKYSDKRIRYMRVLVKSKS